MKVRFVNFPPGAIPIFYMPRSYVFVLNEDGDWEERFFRRRIGDPIGSSLLVPEVEIMPWYPGAPRQPEEEWKLFQRFLMKRLQPMHYQLDGILTITLRSTEYGGFVWSGDSLRLKNQAYRRDRRPPVWFPV